MGLSYNSLHLSVHTCSYSKRLHTDPAVKFSDMNLEIWKSRIWKKLDKKNLEKNIIEKFLS